MSAISFLLMWVCVGGGSHDCRRVLCNGLDSQPLLMADAELLDAQKGKNNDVCRQRGR